MRITTLLAAIALSWLSVVHSASAGSIQVALTRRTYPCFICLPGNPLLKLTSYSLATTTDGDILSINQVRIEVDDGAGLFNVAPPFGSNTEPPDSLFFPITPSLVADSWITTPGPTILLGADLPGDGMSLWGDLTDDGPQTNFEFAQLSVRTGAPGLFRFAISIADLANAETGIYTESFSFLIPEPTSIGLTTVAVSLFALRAMRRPRARHKGLRR